jgi:hypothetical protein
MKPIEDQPESLAQRIANQYAQIGEVKAVALAGSRLSPFADERSDIDVYVYSSSPITLEQRSKVAHGATRAEIGNSFWEPGDEWLDRQTGISIDVMFRTTSWMEDQLDRVLCRHEASVGYSTCFWYNVRNSRSLFDRVGWFRAIQEKANAPYPAELKQSIVEKNYPILRKNMSSYRHQIELALERNDAVSVNHRVTVLLASYFDIVFALNEQPHPGEKRLVRFAQALCPNLPTDMEDRVQSVVQMPSLAAVDALVDGLEDLLRSVHQ